MREEYFVTEETAGDRIDKFLAEQYENLSRSFLQKLLKSGEVMVDGRPVKASYKVAEGDLISFEVPEAVEPEIVPEDIPLDILYEDHDVILVNKPKGMVVHPAAGHYTGTLVNALMFHCKEDLSGINGVLRPGIVHRIDMDTTGVIIACKNDLAHNSIAAQLKEHSITRRYQAIVHGALKDDEGVIDEPIGRSPKDRKKMAVNYNNGKSAVTHYKVLTRFKDFTHIECRLETGRTHQIRVHMSWQGHPLFNDERYGGDRILKGTTFSKYKQFIENCFAVMPRHALHAQSLGFVHPMTHEAVYFESELPDDFRALLEKWDTYAAASKESNNG